MKDYLTLLETNEAKTPPRDFQKPLSGLLPKLPKPGFGSFGSSPHRAFLKSQGSADWSESCAAVEQRLNEGLCPDCGGLLSGHAAIGWRCLGDCWATYAPNAFAEIRAALDRRKRND